MERNGTISTEGVPCLSVSPLSYGVGHPRAQRKSRSIIRRCMAIYIYDIQLQETVIHLGGRTGDQVYIIVTVAAIPRKGVAKLKVTCTFFDLPFS